ncbi:MAG: diaminopimelate decarboxylase [Bacilli bacterium]
MANEGTLVIGGVASTELVKKFGTPLYVYDVKLMRDRIRAFKETFESLGVRYQIAYASKAFSTIAMVQLVQEEGITLDVVSGGELYTALAAGFPAEHIHFHGNNKSDAELEAALQAGIGCFVVDSWYELERLHAIGSQRAKAIAVLLRISPGVEAHTHDYILTGNEDSKFGFDLKSGDAKRAVLFAHQSASLNLLGIHVHIGSQIFETTGFELAIEKMMDALEEWRTDFGFVADVFNVGGGFGIRYISEDDPLHPSEYVRAIVAKLKGQCAQFNYPIPALWIEPGRSIVGDAGTTLYTIGAKKVIPGVRTYVSVDGGMSDNIRPALYEAKYDCDVANRLNDEPNERVSIAGKCCESGDMLIWDADLPTPVQGDILAVYCTGAYNYSMASNYNRLTRPAVVFVEDGEAYEVVRRESVEQIIANDLPLRVRVSK